MYSSRTEVGWGASNVFAYSDVSLFVRALRSIKHIPDAQSFLVMRNGVPIPTLGLGTGGLMEGEATQAIANALHLGYRTLDLARAYGNEHVVKEVLQTRPPPSPQQEFDALTPPKGQASFPAFPTRPDMFLISKVWPTELGFAPTSAAIEASRRDLGTTYIDSYLLHWPRCIPEWPWMNCQDTIDPNGNWIQSWKALEKAYAEGYVQSIGVSNFNVALLDELLAVASVKPHVVQNEGHLGTDEHDTVSLDWDVRAWCTRHNVVYIPYATNRNLKEKGRVWKAPSASDARKRGVHGALDVIAYMRKVSRHAVVLKFFMKTGSAIIPRSSSLRHQYENIMISEFDIDGVDMDRLGWLTAEEEKEL